MIIITTSTTSTTTTNNNTNNLRVLGAPNPGQLFGRGRSGPQATEVKMDPVGSWAATNLTVHSSNSFLGPSIWVRAPGSYSWNASFDVFPFFCVFKPRWRYVDFGRLFSDPIMEDTVGYQKLGCSIFWAFRRLGEGTWSLVVSWRTTFCNILAASARILFVKCIFECFLFFLCFHTWGGYVDFKTFFDTSRAQLRQGKPAQVKLGWVERHQPAGLTYTLTPDRPPVAACTGIKLI